MRVIVFLLIEVLSLAVGVAGVGQAFGWWRLPWVGDLRYPFAMASEVGMIAGGWICFAASSEAEKRGRT